MIVKEVNLETVCGYTSKLPENDKPEIAFAGKSNVGKSSLINCLMNRKSLARISSHPGKTQTINFYNVNNVMYLTDLPGYGYAKITLSEKEKWGKMIENYLHTSKQLRAVFLLLDIRHTPSENDVQMFDWMVYQGFTPIILATKMDKIKPSQVEEQIAIMQQTLNSEYEVTIIPCSAETKEGREKIWQLMDELIGYEEERPAEEAKKPADPDRKPRWKDTDRPTAKKTAAKKAAKKEANVEAAQKAKKAAAKEAAKKEAEKKAREAARKARKAAAKQAERAGAAVASGQTGARQTGSGKQSSARQTGSGKQSSTRQTGSGKQTSTRQTGSGKQTSTRQTGAGRASGSAKTGGRQAGVSRNSGKTGSGKQTSARQTGSGKGSSKK